MSDQDQDQHQTVSEMSKAVAKESTSIELQKVWAGHSLLGHISFLQQFFQHFLRALSNIKSSLALSLISVFTAFLALSLLCLLAVLFKNINNYLENIGSSQSVSLFLKPGLTEAEVNQLTGVLSLRPELATVEYVSPAKALELFRKSLGENASMLDGLEEENPLPASIEIKIKAHLLDGSGIDRLVNELRQIEQVDQVRYSRGLLQDFGKLFQFLQLSGTLAVALMLLVTGVIVSNTISLAIFSYREEIRIMRLLGARGSFIRAPFLISGSLLGLLAGALAVLCATVIFSFLLSSWPRVLLASQIFPEPVFVSGTILWGVVLIGVFVGWLGAVIGSRVYNTL